MAIEIQRNPKWINESELLHFQLSMDDSTDKILPPVSSNMAGKSPERNEALELGR